MIQRRAPIYVAGLVSEADPYRVRMTKDLWDRYPCAKCEREVLASKKTMTDMKTMLEKLRPHWEEKWQQVLPDLVILCTPCAREHDAGETEQRAYIVPQLDPAIEQRLKNVAENN